MSDCSAATYAGKSFGRTATSSMPVAGLASPLRPGITESPPRGQDPIKVGSPGDILNASGGLGVALAAGHQRKPRAAQRPDQVRFRRRLQNQLAQAQFALRHRGQLVIDLVKELDRQDGLAGLELQFEQIAGGLELALPLGLVEQHPRSEEHTSELQS